MNELVTREYEAKFATPAFLGNAEQAGQWRAPPFKALLRQWWRIAVASGQAYEYREIRKKEGRLFGHAWLDDDKDGEGHVARARKSRVHLRLSHWQAGTLQPTAWSTDFEKVVTTRNGKGRVSGDVYLGFGPISHKNGKPSNVSLSNLQTATLRMRFPSAHSAELDQTTQLIAWFGALGSRSRNGWGSLTLSQASLLDLSAAQLHPFTRNVADCMELDWPHAIGRDDDGPLVWRSRCVADWRKAMSQLAHLKVALRREAKDFPRNGEIGGIHLLGYPAGKDWKVSGLEKNGGRLASQFRFKVVKTPEGYHGMVYHIPAGFPHTLRQVLRKTDQDWITRTQLEVWRSIHGLMDRSDVFSRLV